MKNVSFGGMEFDITHRVRAETATFRAISEIKLLCIADSTAEEKYES